MTCSVGRIGGNCAVDYEHYRIIQQLIALGIQPSGNKATDKARLQIEKEKLVNKVAEKNNKTNVDFAETLEATQKKQELREQMEEERLGAKTIGELNRILLGI